MPGNPFRKPYRGGKTSARVKSPSKPNPRVSHVPTPASANGITSRRVAAPRSPSVKVTTKARKSMKPAPVRQGAQMGTPGKTGSRSGASYE